MSTLSPPKDPAGIPTAQERAAEGGEPALLSAPSRLRWAGLALSLSLTGLVWLLKLEADPHADALEESGPAPSDEPAELENPDPSTLAPARRGYPRWATGLLLMLGLAGVATLHQRQLSRHPWGSRLAEPIPPSVHTLSGALQQNYEQKKAQLRQAFEAGQIPTGEGPRGILEHEVQPGETLWHLTQMYQLDAAAITVSNGIQASTPLRPGQKLLIPSQPGLIYSVKPGDTLEDIANRYRVPQQRIIEATPLDRPEYLRIGQRLLIPGDVGELIRRENEMLARREAEERRRQEEEAQEQARLQAEQQRQAQQMQQERQALLAGGSLVHTVGAGDTIERIAARYGVTQRSIIQANHLRNPHWLRIGQRLTIPAPGTQPAPPAPGRRARSQSQARPAPAAPPPALPPARSSGFIWPVAGQITSGFGYRRGRFHAGVDIPGPVGSPIVAVQEGEVIFAGNAGDGYGNRVDIRHPNGIVTRYAHGHRIYVSKGQYVQQGQVIMSRGNTGRSTGPHLHFEVRPGGGAPVDPRPYLP
ncbi:peptidase M23 [Synechococcus sp. 65AY6Li]|nr:peptidase, M23B family [Synechococcus sp. JA-3-3Ab]PIK92412.1 peptidase M23 [Synechococcus sp. 65AY6Li]